MGYISSESIEEISESLARVDKNILFALMFVFLTLTTKYLFIPFAIIFGLIETIIYGFKNINNEDININKTKYELYQTILYLFLVILEFLTLNQSNIIILNPYYSTLEEVWKNPIAPVYTYILYQIIIGHYIQSIIRQLSNWSNDLPLFIHHLLTTGLACYAYNNNIEMMAIYTLFIHDISDIFLHYGKYLYYTNSGFLWVLIDYILLLSSWFYFRLFIIPYICYSIMTEAPIYTIISMNEWNGPLMLFSVGILYICHLYWTYKLLSIGIKIVRES